MQQRKLLVKVILLVITVALGPVVGTQPATAAETVTCDTSFGANVPVLMVHGFNSDPDIWTAGTISMFDAVSKSKGIKVVKPFDYKNAHAKWVTDKAIGPKLAATIDCLAQASRRNGGKGKVITIGHSMGGLALRYAASQVIEGRKVSDEMGLVVTLGTPHLGSIWGNVATGVGHVGCNIAAGATTFNPVLGIAMNRNECMANMAVKGLAEHSKELADLPPFAATIPVRSIAGSVSIYIQLFFTEIKRKATGDLVVSADSAMDEYTTTGAGDEKFAFGCDVHRYQQVSDALRGGECSHTEMVKATYIQASVRQGVEDYLASFNKPALPSGHAVQLFNKLTMTYLNTWDSAQGIPGAVENIVDNSRCNDITARCPHIMIVNLDSEYGRTTYRSNPVETAARNACNQHASPLVAKRTVDIGNDMVPYYEQSCPPDAGIATQFYYWYDEGRGVFMSAYDAVGGAYGANEFAAVLANVVWQ